MTTLTASPDESYTNAVNDLNKEQSSEMFHAKQIENTPFRVIETETETFLTLGKYKIKYEGYEYQDYVKIVTEKHWDLILDVIGICTQIKHT